MVRLIMLLLALPSKNLVPKVRGFILAARAHSVLGFFLVVVGVETLGTFRADAVGEVGLRAVADVTFHRGPVAGLVANILAGGANGQKPGERFDLGEGGGQFLDELLALGLSADALGVVAVNAQNDLAPIALEQGGVGHDAHRSTVLPDVDGVVIAARAGFQKLAKSFFAAGVVDRQRFQTHADELVARETEDLAGFRIGVENGFAFQFEDHDGIVGVFKQSSILALGLAQTFFGSPAPSDIPNRQ